MNDAIAESNRRLTVIVDPHIKAVSSYYVWENGIELEDLPEPVGNYTNVYVRDDITNDVFFGDCWPGNSSWIDFLNENAQNYWGQQMLYKNFKGSSYLYSFWNDMNEPSVFSTSSKTLPMNTVHWKVDGTKVFHRDFHNAYGAMQQRSSFRGMLSRDEDTRRPFVLTRSFFLGSQKFGTYWTGDNRAIFSEVAGSMRMVMSLGISGHPFGGADVPGFYGKPTEELWVMFFQMGMYYPFFRSHTHIDYPNREPWLQSQRVQAVIRDTLSRRYDFIHYLYTTFKMTTRTAEPIMRPMW
jgi:mannosyl-oligosaccharide alpha-1,3-glucosidase